MLNKESVRKQIIRADTDRFVAYSNDDGSEIALSNIIFQELVCEWLLELYGTGAFLLTNRAKERLSDKVEDRVAMYLDETDRYI